MTQSQTPLKTFKELQAESSVTAAWLLSHRGPKLIIRPATTDNWRFTASNLPVDERHYKLLVIPLPEPVARWE